MARYIDVDKEIHGLKRALQKVEHNETTKEIVDLVVEFLEKAPTADVEEVVHCKECKFTYTCVIKTFSEFGDDGYCHLAERKNAQ